MRELAPRPLGFRARLRDIASRAENREDRPMGQRKTTFFFELGDYSLSIVDATLAVMGPNAQAALRAEKALAEALESERGLRLVAEVIRGGDQKYTDELMRKLGLFSPAVPTEDTSSWEEKPLTPISISADSTARIKELQLLCSKIIADGDVDDGELAMIDGWIERNKEAVDIWPVSELCDILRYIRADGVVTSDERVRLFNFLRSIAVAPAQKGEAAEVIFDSAPNIEFPGKLFVFTGELQMGTRQQARDAVASRGGRSSDSPSQKMSYLVVGDLGSANWAHSRYGRKIQAAMDYKRRKLSVVIAREDIFVEALQRG